MPTPPPPPNRPNRTNPPTPASAIPPAPGPAQPVRPAPRRTSPQNDPLGIGVAPAPRSSARVSPLALTAMILGCVGLLVSMLGGGVLGLAAVILAFIANSQMNSRPLELGGKAFAWIGFGTGVAAILATIYFFVGASALRGMNDGDNQRRCAANISGIMRSANVYANDNNDDFPIILPPTTGSVTFGGGVSGGATADATITNIYTRATVRGNVYSNLYLLVLKSYNAPKQFVCPSDPAGVSPAAPDGNLNGFPGVQNVSYSFALPWNAAGQKIGFWRAIVDASLPLMADIAPVNGDTVASGTIQVNTLPTRPNLWNSQSHVNGQMVGWSDAHASFEKKPTIGYADDNIWTANNGTPSPSGSIPKYGPPTDSGTLTRSITNYESGGGSQNWDIFMVPARNSKGLTQ